MSNRKLYVEEIDTIVENNREEILKLLTETLKTPSVTGEEEAVSRIFAKWLEKEGMSIAFHNAMPNRPNLIADWVGNEQGPTFLFLGHCDVFPPIEGNPGKYGPWSGKIEGGDIYGRGSADMKSGDVAAIMATILLKRNGYVPNGKIKLAFVCDEERGGELGTKYLISHDLLQADFGINMEASMRGGIVTEGDGVMFLKITYRSDSLSPVDEGLDALQKGIRAIGKLYEIEETLKTERYHYGEKEYQNHGAILSVTRLHTQADPGRRSHCCEIYVDRRVSTDETLEQSKGEIVSVLEQLKTEDCKMEYGFEVDFEVGAFIVEPDSKLIQSVAHASYTFFGQEPEMIHRCSGGDATKITQAYGYPLPHFGPGLFDQLCIPDEKVSIQDVLDYIKAYMLVVQDMIPCKVYKS